MVPASWTSDEQGRIRVDGLPAGEYAYSATSADGSQTVEGGATVVAETVAEVLGMFP